VADGTWTTDQLKELMDVKFESVKEIANIREQHRQDIRAADQEALRLSLENHKEHFERLNENAARTIEERGHFVSHDTFDPFRESVQEQLAIARGRSGGVSMSAGVLVGGLAALTTVISIVVVLAHVLTGN